MNKNKKIIIITSICLLLLIIIGSTYAYFTAGTLSSEETSTIIVGGGTLRITYADLDPSITIQNAYPRDEEWASKTFTITGTNTTDLKMNYKLYLVVDKNTFSTNTLSYELTGGINDRVINNDGIVPTSGKEVIGLGQFLTGTDIDYDYTLKIFCKDNAQNQNTNQGASFAGHIGVEDAKTGELITMPAKGDKIKLNTGAGLPSIYLY